jgi:transposase
LRTELFTPYEKIVQLIYDFYLLKISPATIETFISTASNSLDAYENEVRMKLLDSPILHADETGFRVEGKRWWLHSLSNERLTYYGVSPKRGSEAIESIGLIPKYTGVLIHDFWQAYAKYPCTHAYCNAHIIRELQGIYEGFGQKWAKNMRTLLEEMYKYTFGREEQSKHQIQEFSERYDRLIMQGELANPPPPKEEGKRGKTKKTKGGNLVERMKKHKDDILRFLTTGGKIPFTNNQAEQDIRMMKVQQKISGTFRTKAGANQFARIRGDISTMRKHGQSVCEALKALAAAQPILISKLGGE